MRFLYILDLQGSQTILEKDTNQQRFLYILDLQGSQTGASAWPAAVIVSLHS